MRVDRRVDGAGWGVGGLRLRKFEGFDGGDGRGLVEVRVGGGRSWMEDEDFGWLSPCPGVGEEDSLVSQRGIRGRQNFSIWRLDM